MLTDNLSIVFSNDFTTVTIIGSDLEEKILSPLIRQVGVQSPFQRQLMK